MERRPGDPDNKPADDDGIADELAHERSAGKDLGPTSVKARLEGAKHPPSGYAEAEALKEARRSGRPNAGYGDRVPDPTRS